MVLQKCFTIENYESILIYKTLLSVVVCEDDDDDDNDEDDEDEALP